MARPKEFDETKALERALDLFWRHGYEATPVQALLDVMGIGRGSLYATFGDKHALYLAALDRYQEQAGASFLACLSAGKPAREAIRCLFEAVVDEAAGEGGTRGCFMVNAAAERALLDPAVADRARAAVAGLEEALFHTVVQGQKRGEVAAHHDPRALARFLTNGVQGLRVMSKMTRDRAVLDDIVATTLSILER